MTLDKRVVLVTGAASGIGRASAQFFARRGSTVVCVDVDEPGLRETVASISASEGLAECCVCDVSRADDCRRAVEAAAAAGDLAALVNVAGMVFSGDTVEQTSEKDWDWLFAVNVKSVFLMSRYAIPMMRAAGSGVIINTASVHAFATMPESAAYAASKGAIVALTRQMAIDLSKDLIRVVAVAPGSVDTPMTARAVASRGKSLEELGFSRLPRVIGHIGRPEQIAAAIVWLASDEASFVNGATLPVDGGLLAKLV